ncbi:MAG: hypothetical protein HZA70_05000 [Planctomycetes bacterium]|nr:hypothetical protein [Planctomycetota bacterium]
MDSGKSNLENSVDIRPVELEINPSGKMTLELPHLKLFLSGLRLRLLFLPSLFIPRSEINLESAPVEVELGDGHTKGVLQPPGP